MATDLSFVEYIADQSQLRDRLTHKKMFGEFGLYLDGKIVAFACDNSLFVKPAAATDRLTAGLPKRPPYPGAKLYPVADELLSTIRTGCASCCSPPNVRCRRRSPRRRANASQNELCVAAHRPAGMPHSRNQELSVTSHKPAAHNAVSPYLLVAGVAGMLAFLKATFNAVELYKQQLPDGTIKHAEARIDDSVIMLGERPDGRDPTCCSTHVYVADVDAAYQRALAAGATSVSEPRDQPYGDRTSGVRDPQGNIWWIGTHLQD